MCYFQKKMEVKQHKQNISWMDDYLVDCASIVKHPYSSIRLTLEILKPDVWSGLQGGHNMRLFLSYSKN